MHSWLSIGMCLLAAGCGEPTSARQMGDECVAVDSAPIGCGHNAEFEVAYSGDEGQLVGANARVCRNTTCADVTLPIVATEMGVGHGETVHGAFGVTVTVYRRAQLEIEAGTFEASEGLVDGDTYSLTIRANDGAVLAAGQWSARYSVIWAASACGPGCMHAELTALP